MNPATLAIHGFRESCRAQVPLLTEVQKIDSLRTKSSLITTQASRKKILEQMVQVEFQKITTHIAKPASSSEKIKELEQVRSGLKKFVEILPTSNKDQIKRSFSKLPKEYRNSLYQAVLVNDCLKKIKIVDSQHGRSKVLKNPLILKQTSESVIDLHGQTLVEQLLHSVENQRYIEWQKECVRILKEVKTLTKKPKPDKKAILDVFAKLPKKLQEKMIADTRTASSGKKGKKELQSNPQLLSRLVHPKSKTKETILNFHIRTETDFQDRCLKIKELFALEKLIFLRPLAQGSTQWKILKTAISPEMQKRWVRQVEKFFAPCKEEKKASSRAKPASSNLNNVSPNKTERVHKKVPAQSSLEQRAERLTKQFMALKERTPKNSGYSVHLTSDDCQTFKLAIHPHGTSNGKIQAPNPDRILQCSCCRTGYEHTFKNQSEDSFGGRLSSEIRKYDMFAVTSDSGNLLLIPDTFNRNVKIDSYHHIYQLDEKKLKKVFLAALRAVAFIKPYLPTYKPDIEWHVGNDGGQTVWILHTRFMRLPDSIKSIIKRSA